MKRDKMTTIVYKSQQENEILGNTNPTGYRGELGCSRRVAVTQSFDYERARRRLLHKRIVHTKLSILFTTLNILIIHAHVPYASITQ
jgi:hypothetical protein